MALKKYSYFLHIGIVWVFDFNIVGMEDQHKNNFSYSDKASSSLEQNNEAFESGELDELIIKKQQFVAKNKRHSAEMMKARKPKISETRRRTLQNIEELVSVCSLLKRKKKKSSGEKEEPQEHINIQESENLLADSNDNSEIPNLEFIKELIRELPEELQQLVLNKYYRSVSNEEIEPQNSVSPEEGQSGMAVNSDILPNTNANSIEAKKLSIKKIIYGVGSVAWLILSVLTQDPVTGAISGLLANNVDN